jgi:hypothetical protein
MMQVPVATSHIFSVLSPLADTMKLSAEEIQHAFTLFLWPLNVWDVVTGNCTHTFVHITTNCALSGDDQRVAAVNMYNDNISILHIKTGGCK